MKTVTTEKHHIVPFSALSSYAMTELDDIATAFTHTREAKEAPMVPLERGAVKASWIGAVALDRQTDYPVSWIRADEPVKHMGRWRTELGGEATLEEHRGNRLSFATVAVAVAEAAERTDYPEPVLLSSANNGSLKGFQHNGFRPAHPIEVPAEVTEFCRTDCGNYPELEIGQMCCDTVMILDTTWQQDEEGLYVPRYPETDQAADPL